MDIKSVKIANILRAKVAVVGESQVGKTSMCHQLTSDGTNFPKNYLMTHCSEVSVKSVNIPDTNDCIDLFLLDCSGREIYRDLLTDEIWKNVAMVVAMYDVTKEETFGSVTKWIELVAKSTGKGEKAGLKGVLLANKTDMKDRRVISPKAGSELAQQLGLMYFECSCKDFNGVEDPCYYLANEFHKLHEEMGEAISNFTA